MSIRSRGDSELKSANKFPFLTHPSEPMDKYSEYLAKGPLPPDEFRNPRNLFDDSNSIDKKWLKSAQAYLEGRSLGSTASR